MRVKSQSFAISMLFFMPFLSKAQLSYDSISPVFIQNTINYLASDKLKGRVNFTKEQLVAADFLASQFAEFKLDPFPGFNNFFVPFNMRFSGSTDKFECNGRRIADTAFFYIPSRLASEEADINDFLILKAEHPVAKSLLVYNWHTKNDKTLIWLDLPDSVSLADAFKNVMIPEGMPSSDILILSSKEEPASLKFKPDKDRIGSVLHNVVGMIPGDSLPTEGIIFSAHYDHIDTDITGRRGEVFNGANDDASGTTAVVALAKYFSERHDNKRTLIFCLFAGEELGLFGSAAFANLVVPEKIKAVINIEMIGATNAVGKNAFMVTGPEYSTLDEILSKNLKDDQVRVKKLNADPTRLFERSDNFSFALRGIPAQTLMCSDDKDPCYHKPCDDVKRIDLINMTNIIRAIAKSATSLIDGSDTPSRIKN